MHGYVAIFWERNKQDVICEGQMCRILQVNGHLLYSQGQRYISPACIQQIFPLIQISKGRMQERTFTVWIDKLVLSTWNSKIATDFARL